MLIALARLRDMGVLQQSTVFLLSLAAGMAIVVLAAEGGVTGNWPPFFDGPPDLANDQKVSLYP